MNNRTPNSPFRKCDYCKRGDRLQDTEPRLLRRAWTLFNNSRKLACPSCERQARTEDRRVGMLIQQHRQLLQHRILAEPEGEYGDTPLRCTHLLQFKGSEDWISVHHLEGRYYGLHADWDIRVDDRRIHKTVKLSVEHNSAAAA